MNAQEFYDLIDLPADVREIYEQYDRENTPFADAGLNARLLRRDQWADAVKELQARIGEDEGNLRLLWEELRIAVQRFPDWEAKGIPMEIYRDTMRFATRYLWDGKAAFGHFCFTAGWWFPRQLAMELFRLGSLEFEIMELPETGERRVSLHIPSDASLAREAVDDSIARFRAFARRFYPDWEQVPMWCDSWMLSPVLQELLPEGSRILAFQHRFDVTEVNADSMGAVGWVFPGWKEPSPDLPEGTALQRRMKAFLLQGGKPGWAAGKMKD